MKKILSIALFGDGTRKDGSGCDYHRYLPSFVRAALNLFPADEDWRLRVHVDDLTLASGYGQFLGRLAEIDLLDVAAMGPANLTKAMLWRMAPVFEDGVDYVFCRDIDCVPMPRDRAVCDKFVETPACAVHTVHDSSSHAGIMGGLCGFQAAKFREVTKLATLESLYAYGAQTDQQWSQHGTDQTVLNRLIDRKDGPTLLEHRFNGWGAGHAGAHPPRAAGNYACQAFSTPTPDVGKSRLSPELQTEADRLAMHLGAAGYDYERARGFWDEHGDAVITRRVAECE